MWPEQHRREVERTTLLRLLSMNKGSRGTSNDAALKGFAGNRVGEKPTANLPQHTKTAVRPDPLRWQVTSTWDELRDLLRDEVRDWDGRVNERHRGVMVSPGQCVAVEHQIRRGTASVSRCICRTWCPGAPTPSAVRWQGNGDRRSAGACRSRSSCQAPFMTNGPSQRTPPRLATPFSSPSHALCPGCARLPRSARPRR